MALLDLVQLYCMCTSYNEHLDLPDIIELVNNIDFAGNRHLLSCDPVWHSLLKHYEDNGKIVEAADFAR